MAAVYDKDDLNDIENSAGNDRYSTGWSGDDANYGTKWGGEYESDKLANADQSPTEHENALPGGYTGQGSEKDGSGKPGRFGKLKFKFTRKKAIGLALATSIVGGIIYFFTILTGPLQLAHLGQILGKTEFGNEQTSAIRTKGLFRYARTGDIAETRLTRFGSKVYNRTLGQLKEIGIEFDRNSRGIVKSMTINTKKFPEYKGLTNEQIRQRIIKDFKITNPAILQRLSSNVWRINVEGISSKSFNFSAALVDTAIGKLSNGKLSTAMAKRYVKTAWKLPRLFSPLTNVKNVAKEKFLAFVGREKSRQAKNQEPAKAKVAASKAKVKDVIRKNGGKISIALLGTQTLCLIRSIADDVVEVNRGAIVLPATISAVDKMAVGSQVQTGKNFDANQAGAVTATFKDEQGKSIWGAKALQILAKGSSNSTEDLPGEYVQAFSGKTTADGIRSAIEMKIAGVSVTGLVCSKVGLVAQLVLAAAVLLAGIPTGGGSWAAFVAGQAAAAVAAAGAIYMLSQTFSSLIDEDTIVPDVLSGPLGGNLLAYGARESANVGARGSGGVELSESESLALDRQQQIDEETEFNSKSVFAKVFDAQDRRSIAGQVVDNLSPSISQNVSKMAHSFINFGHSLGAISKLFSPLVKAEEEPKPYNWGFPKYGIPRDLAEDQRYEDPYLNTCYLFGCKGEGIAGFMVDEIGKETLVGAAAISKAKKCFGVDISKDSSNEWAVTANEDVNPASSDYTGAQCNDTSEEWQRIMLFVFDSRLMDAQACYELNDTEACDALVISTAELGGGGPGGGGGGGAVDCNSVSSLDQSPGDIGSVPAAYRPFIAAAAEGLTCPDYAKPSGAFPATPGTQYFAACSDNCAIQGTKDGKRYIQVKYRDPPGSGNTINELFIDP